MSLFPLTCPAASLPGPILSTVTRGDKSSAWSCRSMEPRLGWMTVSCVGAWINTSSPDPISEFPQAEQTKSLALDHLLSRPYLVSASLYEVRWESDRTMRNIGASLARWEVDRTTLVDQNPYSHLSKFCHWRSISYKTKLIFNSDENVLLRIIHSDSCRMLPSLFCSTCKAEPTLAMS